MANDSVPFTVSVAGDVVEKSARSDYAVLAGQRDRDVVVAPDKDPSATRYDRLTHDEAIARNLQVMDTAAFALCRTTVSRSWCSRSMSLALSPRR